MRPDQRPAGAFSDPDLKKRVVSALVLIPVAIFTAWLGDWPFAILWLCGAALVLREWNRLVLPEAPPALYAGELVALTAALGLERYFLNPGFAMVALGAGAGVALALSPQGRSRWAIAGLLYAAAVVLGPTILRDDNASRASSPSSGSSRWSGAPTSPPISAGRSIGGPKLWPRLSPKKTWSGFIGGTLIGTAIALVVVRIAGIPLSIGLALATWVIAALSQGGDLFESSVKRRFAAKDAGSLIPGHGGVMDRLDGFLVAAVAAAALGLMRGGSANPAAGLLVW
jgi:phosphatidate cytidylyltransferase